MSLCTRWRALLVACALGLGACSLDFDALVRDAPDAGVAGDGSTDAAPGEGEAGTNTGLSEAGTGTDASSADGAVDATVDGSDGTVDAGADAGQVPACEPLAADLRFTQVTTGADMSCAIRNQEIICFGRNSSGQRGLGNSENASPIAAVSGISDALEIAAGRYHVCARRAAGAVLCWGQNWDGQLGHAGDSELPGAVAEVPDAISIAAGEYHSCAARSDGSVYCWGQNSSLQIGVADTADQTPIQVPGVTGAVQVAAGGDHSCALAGDGAVYCWGENGDGQLGNDSTTDSMSPSRVVLTGGGELPAMEAIASGDDHVCALTTDSRVYCWGENDYGQLGNDSATSLSVATAVKGLDGVVIEAITAGEEHSCAIDDQGLAYCWGQNRSGELGDGSQVNRALPTALASLPPLVAIDAGGDDVGSHSCAIDVCGRLYCWGAGGHGQLGDGRLPHSTALVKVTDNADGVWLGANHTCFTRSGELFCFGRNDEGQLGDGTQLARSEPGSVAILADVKDVALGLHHSCAVQNDGDLYCWGKNGSDQLGLGDSRSEITAPAQLLGSEWSQVASGEEHSCALDTAGGVFCWGRNGVGQLGLMGVTPAPTPAALDLSGLGITVTDELSADQDFSCARSGASVVCWGDNADGQLGQGAASATPSLPATVAGVSASAIAAGHDHVCVISDAAGLICWGDNSQGQLGDGTTTDHFDPNVVPSLGGFGLLEAGDRFTCAANGDGLLCFGENDYGQLGRGTVTSRETSPGAGPAFNRVDALGLGQAHACVVGRLDGNDGLYCWGRSAYGQLGDGVAVVWPSPREVTAL